MISFLESRRGTLTHKLLCSFIALTFITSMIVPPQAQAQSLPGTILNLPIPGSMVGISGGYVPALVKGIRINPENPLSFNFIVDTGESGLEGALLNEEAEKLIKYFLASLTVPEKEMWVNLSPYEKDRIIPESLGVTELGRDLLAQDYLLKQLTASLIYPENDLGNKFWQKVYERVKVYAQDIPASGGRNPDYYNHMLENVGTFNKIWIVPDKAVVYEHDGGAYVLDSHLKVMLEEDYMAQEYVRGQLPVVSDQLPVDSDQSRDTNDHGSTMSDVVREVLIPAIEEEINTGKNFAPLRQIYNSMILAVWYKMNLQASLLGQVYVDKNKTKGIDVEDREVKQKIYEQYLEAFKVGVYDYIKEEYDPTVKQVIPRKYFSGGAAVVDRADIEIIRGPQGLEGRRDLLASALPRGNILDVTTTLVENAKEGDVAPVDRAEFSFSSKLNIGIPAVLLAASAIIIANCTGMCGTGSTSEEQTAIENTVNNLLEAIDSVAVRQLAREVIFEREVNRIKAAERLAELNNKEAIPFLVLALEDEKAKVMGVALKAIQSIGFEGVDQSFIDETKRILIKYAEMPSIDIGWGSAEINRNQKRALALDGLVALDRYFSPAPSTEAGARDSDVEPKDRSATVEIDQKLLDDFTGLFEKKEVNGRILDPLEVIAALTEAAGPDIPRALNARRLLLESKAPAREKYAFPKWGEQFTDALGNTRTFRQIVQGMMDNFLGIESELSWRMNDDVPVPDEIFPLSRPGLQITGPSDPLDMAIKQLNAILSVRMPDMEDASAAWYVPVGSEEGRKVGAYAGIQNETELFKGEWEGKALKKGNKEYKLTQDKKKRPVTIQRVPSIHLVDQHIMINGKATPAIAIAYALHFLNTHGALMKNESGNYYYQPKIQTPKEALIVERVLMKLEELTGLPLGSIKIEMLYEEGNAGRWLPAIMWVWRHRLIGSNVGRWDYIGSLIEMWKDEAVFPDPQGINMNTAQLVAYQRYNALLNLMVGVRDGKQLNAAPIGGMAAVMLYPPTDRYGRHRNNPKALRGMKIDKLRERLLGLIFLADEPLADGAQPTLEDILSGKVKGRLYDTYRQSWVATPDSAYVAAGNEPLQVLIEELQQLLDRPEEWEMDGDKKVAPKVSSGLIEGERTLFKTLKLLNADGKILPGVISKDKFNKPEDLFNEQLWNDLYSVPKGDITIEHVQHAFYMSAQYGFQILNGNYAAAIDDYELGLRFMNDLATYRIFISWLWSIFHHQAEVTKNGWIKDPELVDDLGVVPHKNILELTAGTKLTPEVFDQVWAAHDRWTKAFFAEQDRLGAKSDFDRTWADVIMDVLKRQLLSPKYMQHSPRILFVLAQMRPDLHERFLNAVFDLSREEAVANAHAAQRAWERTQMVDLLAEANDAKSILEYRDYVFDYYEVTASELESEWEVDLYPADDIAGDIVTVRELWDNEYTIRSMSYHKGAYYIVPQQTVRVRSGTEHFTMTVGEILSKKPARSDDRAEATQALQPDWVVELKTNVRARRDTEVTVASVRDLWNPQSFVWAGDLGLNKDDTVVVHPEGMGVPGFEMSIRDILAQKPAEPKDRSAVGLQQEEGLFSDANVRLTEEELLEAQELEEKWESSGVTRPYSAQKVISLRGHRKTRPDYAVARNQAVHFRTVVGDPNVIAAGLGAISGRQAVMQVRAGAPVIYDSGWQVAGKQMLPDISSHSVDEVVNHAKALIDAQHKASAYYRRVNVPFEPVSVVVDIDAGFGSPAKIYNLVSRLIDVGVGVIHIEDQDPCEKACGHLGGKLKHPAHLFRNSIAAARMAFDVAGVPGVIIGRTDSEAATIVRGEGDVNDTDRPFIVGRSFSGKTADGTDMLYSEAERQGKVITWTSVQSEVNALINKHGAANVWVGSELTHREARERGLNIVWNAAPEEQQGMIQAFGESKVWIAQRSAPEGYYRVSKEGQKANLQYAIESALSYGDLTDLVWMETKTPDLFEAMEFAEAVHKQFGPEKKLAYNLSPSFKWRKKFESEEGRERFIAAIKKIDFSSSPEKDKPWASKDFDWESGYTPEIAMEAFVPAIHALGYKFQFITLAGFHSEAFAQFDLAYKFYSGRYMAAYSELQEEEAEAINRGYYGELHQREVGTHWYQALDEHVKGGETSRKIMSASTEASQFGKKASGGDRSEATPLGGIDLNAEHLDLQIKRDGQGVPLPLWQQPVDMNIEGFLPVIINVTPVSSLPLLLGLGELPEEGAPKTDFGKELSPADRKARFEVGEPEKVSMLN